MKLKTRSKAMENFSMSSMTDVIFLLLIFFMITSTLVVPSSLKVTLPQSSQQQTSERPMVRITLDRDLHYYVALGSGEEQAVAFEEIAPFLAHAAEVEPEMFVALYADEEVPYREIVRLLNLAVENRYQMVLATRPLE